MKKFSKALLGGGLIMATALVLAVAPARATDISGTITTTLTIFEDSRLVGNVTCNVTLTPCIKFGASNIALDLNGFAISGNPVLCGARMGVDTNAQTNVKIKGPGVVRNFLTGILINGGANNKVDGLTVSGIFCGDEGIDLLGSSDNDVEGNTVVGSAGGTFGIVITANSSGIGSNNNHLRHNDISGFNNGVRLAGVVTGNLIEENAVLGNGAGITIQAGATGNLVRRNAVFDNTSGGPIFDINDANAAGANTYQDNLCDVSTGTGAAGVCPNIPSFAGHRNVQ